MGLIAKSDPNTPSRASLAIGSSSYTSNEEQQFAFTIERSTRTDQELNVDWQFSGVTVTPTSGTAVFSTGVAIVTVSVSADTISANETGTLALTSAYWVSGPDAQPVIGSPNQVNIFLVNVSPAISDTDDYDDPVSAVTLLSPRSTVEVNNDTELATALANASPGDTIKLGANVYSSNHLISTSCPGNNPVIIQGVANYQAQMSGLLTMEGAANIATGLLFSGQNARMILKGYNNKSIANKFTGTKGTMIRPGDSNGPNPGSHCEIAYNEFYSPGDWNFTAPPTEFRMAVRMTTGNSAGSVHTDGWLHHNYVHDFPDKPNNDYASGQADSFELGEAAYSWNQTPISWWVEDNLIDNHAQSGQASLIDIKSAGIVCRRNRAINSTNIRIDVRLGGQAIIEANDCGGSHVHSIGNIIAGNKFDGSGIGLIAGDQVYDATQTPTENHQQCVENLVTGNDCTGATLTLGKFSGGDQTFPALRTKIEDHTGGISLELETSTSGSAGAATTRVFESVTTIASADVGPDALANAPASYRNARIPGG